MHRITAILNDSELLELASMTMAVNGWPEGAHDHPLYGALRKLNESCMLNCSREQREIIGKSFDAMVSSFSEPSIERGMLQGGLLGMIERMGEEMNKLD